jgi:hypothetical protein
VPSMSRSTQVISCQGNAMRHPSKSQFIHIFIPFSADFSTDSPLDPNDHNA